MRMCEICQSNMMSFDEGRVFGKYTVTYDLCSSCGFVQTEEPYWLDEAYSDAIVSADIGLVGRNMENARFVAAICAVCLPECHTALDYGGGYGMFVRMMRDAGYNFEWYDRYCDNLFAKHFEKRKDHYDLVTAFELFEHLPHPVKEVEELIDLGDHLLFTTALLPSPPPKVADWWYYAPHAGQHISFYTRRSLELLAKRFGRRYVGYRDIHLFAKTSVPQWKFVMAIRFAAVVNRLYRRESLLAADYHSITGMRI